MATKKKVFDSDSDDETELTINKNYASRYDVWRQKEELQKLKDKYGEEAGESNSESSSDDEAVEPELEKEFFTTLSILKKKDPKIYDASVTFFPKNDVETKGEDKEKKKKSKPFYLKDHDREMLLTKSEAKSDNDDDTDEDVVENRKIKHNFHGVSAKETEELRQSFKNMPSEDEDDDLLTVRKKTKKEKEKEEADFIEWLKGNQDDVDDTEAKAEMKDLHDYWNNPTLDTDEKFLKDYILNKKYMDEDNDDDRIPSYDEIIHDSEGLSEDEKTLDLQDTFEHKYNFRFEEPDQDFIKRYPRTMTDIFRKQDDRRKKKRAEIKERKLQERARKDEELKQLKALKRKEIMEKLNKLEKITGNTSSAFDKNFLKGDFDPEEHERKMREIFDDEYYQEEEDGSKPEFEMDEEIDGDYENWDEYENGNCDEYENGNCDENNYDNEPHCEDPDFIMDADYQPSTSYQQEVIDNSKKGRKYKKSKLAQLVQAKKPVFDENDKTFEEYIDEYYKLDYEDIIGDLPCRFKYRETVPSNFGLSFEEILKGDDKELNKWSSLKKTFKYRNEDEEKRDIKMYNKKSKNLKEKKRILTSVYENSEEEENNETHKKKKLKLDQEVVNDEASTSSQSTKKKKDKKKQRFVSKDKISDDRLRAYGINPKKYNNKLKYGNKN